MRAIWVIAKNTFREIIRDRILYGIIVFALLLIGLSLAVGQLSFSEQARISANFGFTGIHLSAVVLAAFIGSSLVSREIEKQTILTLLARPITRGQFLLGQFLGLSGVIAVVMAGLAFVLAGIVSALDFAIEPSFLLALLGILLEALILLAVVLLFGTFARPIMAVIYTVCLFIIGHWVDSLNFFAKSSDSGVFRSAVKILNLALPNFESLNWRSAPIYGDIVPLAEVGRAMGYSAGWILFLMVLTSIIFGRRDFV